MVGVPADADCRAVAAAHENDERSLAAKEGVAFFKEQALRWRLRIERLDEVGLSRLWVSRRRT